MQFHLIVVAIFSKICVKDHGPIARKKDLISTSLYRDALFSDSVNILV